MEPLANASQPFPAYDDFNARLTTLEKTVAALQCDSAALRQRVDSGFEAAQAQFVLTEEKLRREFHDGMHALENSLSAQMQMEAQRLDDKIATASRRLEDRISSEGQALAARIDRQDARIDRLDGSIDRLEAKIDRLDTKIDQLAKWMIGTQVTTLALVVGLAVQLFLR